MSTRDKTSQTEGEHDRAVERLKVAVTQRSRFRHRHKTARGTRDEIAVDASLRDADEQVAARKRWLESVDDHDY